MTELSDSVASKLAEISAVGGWAYGKIERAHDLCVAYCVAFDRNAKAEAKIAEFGELVSGANGFPVASPWLAVSASALKSMQSTRAAIEKVRPLTNRERAAIGLG